MILISIFVIAICVYFCKNNAFKYYAKYTFYCVASTILSFVSLPYLISRPRDVRNLITLSSFYKYMAIPLGLKYELRGMDNLKKEFTCVIVANHQSSIDFLGMYQFWHIMGKVTVIARMLLLFAGTYGIGAWLCGLIFINKGSPDRGKKKMNEALEYLKKNKIKLWMYAEGYRNHTGTIDELKKGAFHLALQANAPIVPLVFSSYTPFLRPNERIFNSGKIIVEALPEISIEGYNTSNLNELIEKTRNVMIKKFDELNNEMKLANESK